jgi:Kef-type K+ transport system membrane component KefB
MVIALFAYLGTALFRLAQMPVVVRSLIASGMGFFFIGILLGPHFIGLIGPEALEGLDVLVNLGVGWVGLLFGLQFRLVDLRRFPPRRYVGAFSEALVTFLVIGTGIWLGVWLTPRAWPVWFTVVVLAVIGSTTSPTTGAQAMHDVKPRGPLTDTVRLFASVDAVPAILLLGAVLCFSSLHATGEDFMQSGLLWVGIACGLGLVLGALFHFLTLYRYTDNQLLVIVLGLTIFCGGAAHFLLLSPLFVNFVVGLVVANRSPRQLRLLKSLLQLEKPIYLILLTLAGAMWMLPPASLVALVPIFVLLRLGGKIVGGILGARVAGLTTKGSLGVGPGLLAQGGMALVLALNVKQFFPGDLGNLALTAAVFSILVSTLLGPRALYRLLHDEGEVS